MKKKILIAMASSLALACLVSGVSINASVETSAETFENGGAFYTVPGASVRLATTKVEGVDYNAMRFSFQITEEKYAEIIDAETKTYKTGASVTAYVALTEKIDLEQTQADLVKDTDVITTAIPADKWTYGNLIEGSTDKAYHACAYVYNLPNDMDKYDDNISAFASLTTTSGTLYSSVQSRSMAYVADAALDSKKYEADRTTLEGYLPAYEVSFYDEDGELLETKQVKYGTELTSALSEYKYAQAIEGWKKLGEEEFLENPEVTGAGAYQLDLFKVSGSVISAIPQYTSYKGSAYYSQDINVTLTSSLGETETVSATAQPNSDGMNASYTYEIVAIAGADDYTLSIVHGNGQNGTGGNNKDDNTANSTNAKYLDYSSVVTVAGTDKKLAEHIMRPWITDCYSGSTVVVENGAYSFSTTSSLGDTTYQAGADGLSGDWYTEITVDGLLDGEIAGVVWGVSGDTTNLYENFMRIGVQNESGTYKVIAQRNAIVKAQTITWDGASDYKLGVMFKNGTAYVYGNGTYLYQVNMTDADGNYTVSYTMGWSADTLMRTGLWVKQSTAYSVKIKDVILAQNTDLFPENSEANGKYSISGKIINPMVTFTDYNTAYYAGYFVVTLTNASGEVVATTKVDGNAGQDGGYYLPNGKVLSDWKYAFSGIENGTYTLKVAHGENTSRARLLEYSQEITVENGNVVHNPKIKNMMGSGTTYVCFNGVPTLSEEGYYSYTMVGNASKYGETAIQNDSGGTPGAWYSEMTVNSLKAGEIAGLSFCDMSNNKKWGNFARIGLKNDSGTIYISVQAAGTETTTKYVLSDYVTWSNDGTSDITLGAYLHGDTTSYMFDIFVNGAYAFTVNSTDEIGTAGALFGSKFTWTYDVDKGATENAGTKVGAGLWLMQAESNSVVFRDWWFVQNAEIFAKIEAIKAKALN